MASVEKWMEAKRAKERGMREEDSDLRKKEMTLADTNGKVSVERESRLNPWCDQGQCLIFLSLSFLSN